MIEMPRVFKLLDFGAPEIPVWWLQTGSLIADRNVKQILNSNRGF
jgi:hypothetical protein